MDGTEILKGIIAKGGVIGGAAKLYLNDPESTDDFILECYHQCHNSVARNLWGEELTREIERYSRNFDKGRIGKTPKIKAKQKIDFIDAF